MSRTLSVAEGYDQIAARYDTLYDGAAVVAENAAAFSRVRGMLSSLVVDLGCGTGLLLEGVPEIEAYVGVDLSRGMLTCARAKFPSRPFMQADLSCTGLPSGCATSVVSLFSAGNYVPLASLGCETLRLLQAYGAFLWILRRAKREREVDGVPLFPHLHSKTQIKIWAAGSGVEELRITGLTRALNEDLFMVVQGRKSA